VTDAHFQRDRTFDLADHWQTHLQAFTDELSEYEFTLRIHQNRLDFVRRLTPGRFNIHEPADKSGWLTLDIHIESIELAKMLVFGLGKDVAVVNPPELEAAVVAAAQAILDHQAD
jgi:predicted DNA-binding transcriptional regulator YafY